MPPLEIAAYAIAGIALIIIVGAIAVVMSDKQIDALMRKINRGE